MVNYFSQRDAMLKDHKILYNGNPAVFMYDSRFTILFNLEDASRQQISFASPRNSDLREFLSAHFAAHRSTGLFEALMHMSDNRRRPKHYGKVININFSFPTKEISKTAVLPDEEARFHFNVQDLPAGNMHNDWCSSLFPEQQE